MRCFYVSGKYRGVNVGIEFSSSNEYEAAIDFAAKILEEFCISRPVDWHKEREKIVVEGVEEVSA